MEDDFSYSGKTEVSSMTTSPARVLKMPPRQNPTTPIIKKMEVTPKDRNLRKKKQRTRATMNGIINRPLFIIFMNK